MQSVKRRETRLTRSATLLLFIVLISAGFSGCTDTGTGSTPSPEMVTLIPAATGTIPPTQISSPAATDRPDAKIFGGFSREEYRENITQTLAPNPRYQWEKIDLLERTQTVHTGNPREDHHHHGLC